MLRGRLASLLEGPYIGDDRVELESYIDISVLLPEILECREALLHNDRLELDQKVPLRELQEVGQALHFSHKALVVHLAVDYFKNVTVCHSLLDLICTREEPLIVSYQYTEVLGKVLSLIRLLEVLGKRLGLKLNYHRLEQLVLLF